MTSCYQTLDKHTINDMSCSKWTFHRISGFAFNVIFPQNKQNIYYCILSKTLFFILSVNHSTLCVHLYWGNSCWNQSMLYDKNNVMKKISLSISNHFSLSSNIDILEIPLKGYNGHIMMRSYHVDKGFLLHQSIS